MFRDFGKGFILEELCRFKGIKNEGNIVFKCFFLENCLSVLFWVCLGCK